MHRRASYLSAAVLSTVLLPGLLHSSPAFSAEDAKKTAETKPAPVSFFKQVRPIFQANCQGCHQPARANGAYVMTEFDRLLSGGESESKAVTPGKPAESYLIHEITPTDGKAEMPKGKPPLSEVEIKLITRWVAEGAKNDTPENARLRYTPESPPIYTQLPAITSVDYSPDGKLLAVAGYHEVLLHKADGSEIVARLVGLSERIESVQFSPDGKRLVVAGGQPGRFGEIQVWDLATKKLTLSHPTTFDTVYGASWSPDGKLIAFGCADNTLRAINSVSGEQVLFQGSHNDWALDTVFSLKGDHVVSVGRDRTAKLTELATQRFVDNITSITPGALKGGILSVDRDPKQEAVLVGGSDGVPKIYRIFRESVRRIGDDGNLIRRFPAQPGRIFGVAFSSDGQRIAAVSSDAGKGEVRVYSTKYEVKIPDNIKKLSEKVAGSRNAAENKVLEAYRVKDIAPLATATIDHSGLYSVTFSPDGKQLAIGAADGQIRLLDIATGKIQKQFDSAPQGGTPPQLTVVESTQETATQKNDEQLTKDQKLVGLAIEPSEVVITNEFDSVQIVAFGKLATDEIVDVTRMAKISLSGDLVSITPNGLIRANANGKTKLTLSIAGQTQTVAVTVSGLNPETKVSYVREVTPVVSKLGCNAGTCHGSKDGKNGFKLSLRGYDPLYDIRALTDDHASRRVNAAAPDNSLMLLKATGSVPHVGGQLTKPGEPNYEVLRRWIAEGANLDVKTAKVKSIAISPHNPVVQTIGSRQQVRVVATYVDGSTRDVTAESFVSSGNMDIVSVDDSSLVTTLRRGEAPVLARYEGAYAATTVTVMGDRSGYKWNAQPANNYIDELVADKWQRMKILPSGLCSDSEFLRRIYLDLTGLPPSADTVRTFLADDRETNVKRDEVIDQLVQTEEYIDHWTNKWADLLQVNRKFLGGQGASAFRGWIREQVKANKPYNVFANDILTATGSNRENPAASYYKILRTPEETMENTTHLFLAVRFNCNKCHDHPFERWTQDQYYETAAFFAQVGLKQDPESKGKRIGGTAVEGAKPLYEIVYDRKDGEQKHERTGAVTAPKLPYTSVHDVAKEASRREKLAGWITSADNQYFAKSYVNRLWGYMTGVGLIEPLDDIRAGNPPTNPVLLDRLTQQFIDNGFDAKDIIKTICKSRTYQLSVETHRWNDDDQINYSHAQARRLPAEVLYDAVHAVMGTKLNIPGVPAGTRAAALPDAGVKLASGFLANLGRPARESSCECERSTGLELGPVMSLVSGPDLSKAISAADSEIAKLVAAEPNDARIIDEMFMRVLNRPASKTEIFACMDLLSSLPAEHQKLNAELKARELHLKPIIAANEKKRADKINKAKTDLAAYEKQIAPRVAAETKTWQANIDAKQAELKKYEAEQPKRLTARESSQAETVWTPLDPETLTAGKGTKLVEQLDRSIVAEGDNKVGSYFITAQTDLIGITGIRLEMMPDKRFPKNGPGRADDGNFVLTELIVQSAVVAADKKKPNPLKPVALHNAKADFSQKGYPVKNLIDGDVTTANGWASSPQLGKLRRATVELKTPLGTGQKTLLKIELKQLFNGNMYQIGRFRISVTTSPAPVKIDGLPNNIANLLAVGATKRNALQKAAVLGYFRKADPQLKTRQTALATAKKPLPIDPKLLEKRQHLAYVEQPLPIDPEFARLTHDLAISAQQLSTQRLIGAQDIAWALINSPSFLFNR